MALKRSLWVGLPALAAACLAVALLPPRPLPERPGLLESVRGGLGWGWVYDDGYRNWGAIQENVTRLTATRLRVRVNEASRGDSLIALARRGGNVMRGADGAVTVLFDPSLPADTARRILRTIERELALYPKADGVGMATIVAIYSDSTRHPDLQKVFWRRYSYVRSGAQGSACIVELNRTPRGTRFDPRTGGWPLNGCAIYARFGPHGSAVAGAAGGWVGEIRFLENPYNWQSTLTDQLVQARLQGAARPAPWEWQPTWVPFFLDTTRYYRPPPFQWRWSACLEGSDTSCLAAAGMLGRRDTRWVSWYLNPFMTTSLVANLLASGDVKRFAAFWRSDRPYAQALESAYGKPAATLVRDVARRRWVPSPHGPHITVRVATAAVGWLVVALGLAIVAGRRRQARS